MIIVSYDFETTGVRSGARAIELAAVRWRNGEEEARFVTLINPGIPIPAEATVIHGITDAMVADAPTAAEVLPLFVDFVGSDAQLVAHNEHFDGRILSMELSIAGLPQLDTARACTMRIAQERVPKRTPEREGPADHKLGTLVAWFEIPHDGTAHRALADALQAGRLWWSLQGVRA